MPTLSLNTFVLCKLWLPSQSFVNMVSSTLFLFLGMVRFPQTVSHDSGQFFSNFECFISCCFVGSREIHSNRDAFIRGQRLYKFMHFLLIASYTILIILWIICSLISFNTVYVFSDYAVLFISMMPVGDKSMFLVGVCGEGGRVFAFKTYFNEVFWLKANVDDKLS